MPVTTLSGGNLTLVAIVAVIAAVALVMAFVFRREVLAAGDGTPNMQNIAQAVQEGATAFLSRQFRTLGVFAVVAFFLLLALPAHTEEPGAHWGLRIGRSIAFLAGAGGADPVGHAADRHAAREGMADPQPRQEGGQRERADQSRQHRQGGSQGRGRSGELRQL